MKVAVEIFIFIVISKSKYKKKKIQIKLNLSDSYIICAQNLIIRIHRSVNFLELCFLGYLAPRQATYATLDTISSTIYY